MSRLVMFDFLMQMFTVLSCVGRSGRTGGKAGVTAGARVCFPPSPNGGDNGNELC